MMRSLLRMLVVAAVFMVANARAFETETHALITRQAYANSVLAQTGPNSLVHQLLLDRLDVPTPFNIYWQSSLPEFYYGDGGVSGGAPANNRVPEDFERCNMQEFFLPSVPRLLRVFGDTVEPAGVSSPLLPIQNWLVRGAIREDDLGYFTIPTYAFKHCGYLSFIDDGTITRVYNHFYDPVQDIPLSPCPGTCQKSVDWALGDVNSFANPPQIDSARRNHYSYADARNAYWWALTREFSHQAAPPYTAAQREADVQDRMRLWATTFRALGDVVHLLQDTGQPQHTRNDSHGPLVSTGEQQAFESFTNARVLGQTGADANSYVQDFFGRKLGDQLPAPPLGSYGAPMFATPLRFFTTRLDGNSLDSRGGLADYTNRGFFTGGTLPGSSGSHPEPKPSLSTPDGYTTVSTPCLGLLDADNRLRAVPCVHYTHAVPDAVNPTYAQTQDLLPPGFTLPNAPLASESVFLKPEGHAGVLIPDTETVIALDELIAIGNLTIPRAIGYSTGMINFFFRGQLTVTPPSTGIYAIVNHGTPHTVDADGIPHLTSNPNLAFGFTALRLQVKNTTPPIFDAGTQSNVTQSTGGSGAKMVAIARYHRNPCYQPDLSGQWSSDEAGGVHAPVNCPSSRTAYPEISVSAEVPVTAGMLDGQQPVEQQFDFSSDPIPINATDVFIQVAYRGVLGSETDGIAVGMVDVSEPSYESNLAMTDIPLQYQEDGLTWKWGPWTSPPWSAWTLPNGHSWAYPPPDPIADLAVTHIEICDGSSQIYLSAPGEQLPENHVVRIAAIRDFTSHTITGQVTFQGQFAGPSTVSSYTRAGGDVNQATDERGGSMFTTYLFYGRGVVGAGDIDFISTCANPYPNTDCLAPPSPPPSPYAQSPSPLPLPNITPPAAGFISEPVGNVTLPITNGSAACTIQGSGLPYAPRSGSPGVRWMSAGRAATARTH